MVRARPCIADKERHHETPREGGLWLRTVCVDCNGLASKYDAAYGELADRIRPHLGSHKLTLPSKGGVPPVSVAPGWVARSVLHAIVALAPSFRHVGVQFMKDLHADRRDLRLPPARRLMVALTSDHHVRIASFCHLDRTLGVGRCYGGFAEIYFRPFCWLLTAGT